MSFCGTLFAPGNNVCPSPSGCIGMLQWEFSIRNSKERASRLRQNPRRSLYLGQQYGFHFGYSVPNHRLNVFVLEFNRGLDGCSDLEWLVASQSEAISVHQPLRGCPRAITSTQSFGIVEGRFACLRRPERLPAVGGRFSADLNLCKSMVNSLHALQATPHTLRENHHQSQRPHPRSSHETARFNASHPRVKAQIQEEIARLVAIGGPAVSARFQN